MYDPSIGRWLSEDPIGFGAGDTNLYRYAGNNPENFTDPSGLDWGPSGWQQHYERERQRRDILGTPDGRWPALDYLSIVLPGMSEDDMVEARRGCVGVANVRLGTDYMTFPTRQASLFRTFAEADA